MKDLREEMRNESCIVGNMIDNSRTKWTGQIIRLKDERLPKGVVTRKEGGFRKRGRQQLR